MKIIKQKGHEILVDDDVYEWASKQKWSFTKSRHTYYAHAQINGKDRKLHRLILGLSDPNVVTDHINGNGLDNRRENIRPCTPLENTLNTHYWPGGNKKTSKYIGVSFSTAHKKFVAQIKHNGKMRHIGLFENERDAAMAYNKVSVELRGDSAILNDLTDE